MLNKECRSISAHGIHVPCISGGLFGGIILFFQNLITEISMNKSELIEIVAKEADLSKAAAGKALEAFTAAIVKAVSKGDTATLIGFGTFKSSKRAARTGRNPQTGKELKIAATTVPRFTAGAGFKAAVAGKKAAKKK